MRKGTQRDVRQSSLAWRIELENKFKNIAWIYEILFKGIHQNALEFSRAS